MLNIGSKTMLTIGWKWTFRLGRYHHDYRGYNMGWYRINMGIWKSRGEEGVEWGGKDKGVTISFYFWLPFYF